MFRHLFVRNGAWSSSYLPLDLYTEKRSNGSKIYDENDGIFDDLLFDRKVSVSVIARGIAAGFGIGKSNDSSQMNVGKKEEMGYFRVGKKEKR